ncbi:putative sieve element occlusion [Helianthus debilis subsp. tardiflorus]
MATTMTLYGRGDRQVFSSSDDNAMMKNILATHSPDGTNIDVIPLLQIIKDIMHRSHPDANIDAIVESVIYHDFNEMFEVLALTINKVACEITCKCGGGGDTHATAIVILNTLSNYGWDAKAVITLAAFAVNYGEFWLVAQLHQTNPLAKSLALLKQLPDVLERRESLKPRFNVVNNLVKAMFDVTHIIIKFKELPEQYISPNTPELVTATTHIPTAVYWIIRSIVACASVLTNLIGMGQGYVIILLLLLPYAFSIT